MAKQNGNSRLNPILVTISSLVFVAAMIAGFQNCTRLGAGQGGGAIDGAMNDSKNDGAGSAGSGSGSGGEGNGQPYDGKPYVLADTCADGTVVNSRLMLAKDGSGVVFRENCQTGAARAVAASEIQVDPLDRSRLTFASRTFTLERPAIPLPGMISWLYQLTGVLRTEPASIYIVDMFETDAAKIQSLKDAGHTVICSMSAGTFESWRPDAASFQTSDKGRKVAGGDERWLDTRSANVRSIMLARLDLAKAKGCHGIDFDSVDGFSNSTGFPLSSETQIDYDRFLAFAAHDRAFILTLNNAPEMASPLAEIFDLAIAEQCFQYGECARYQPFIERGKPVLAAEYGAFSQAACSEAARLKISLAFLSPELDGSRYESCQ